MSERRGQRAQWHGGWGWGRTGPEYAAACTHPRTPTVDTHTPRPSPSPACRAPAPVRTRGTGVRYADVAGIDHIKEDIREVLDILLGGVNMYFTGYSLQFWALGFGVLHIVYGLIMWWKYDYRGAGQ